MAGRTGTSRKGTTRGKTGSKPRTSTSGTRAKAPARKPAARKAPARKRSGGVPIGKAWGLLGRGVGGVVRTVGRTKELDPAHRRDGLGLVLIALAVITAAGVWWRAGGPVGAWVDVAVRSSVGNAAIV